MKSLIKTKKAFTLIEVLLSLAILMIVIVPIFTMVMNTVTINKGGENKQKATLVAQETVEKIKSISDKDFIHLDNYGDVLGLNIVQEKDLDRFNISGQKNGYSIEGYVEKSQGDMPYKYEQHKNVINFDFKIDYEIEDNVNKLFISEQYVTYTPHIIILLDKNNIIIKDGKNGDILKSISNNNGNVLVHLGENTSDNINIDVENKNSNDFNIYISKDLKSLGNCNINNNYGNVKVYNNFENASDNKVSKTLYKIYIKVSKGKDVFEISTYRSVEM